MAPGLKAFPLLSLLAVLVATLSGAGVAGPSRLGAFIEETVRQEADLAPARWGLLVLDPESGQTLYQHDADSLFLPASGLKLLVGAAADHLLGPDYAYATDVLADRPPDPDGTVRGNLYLRGAGDPSLATEDLKEAAVSLGLQQIAGDVVADDLQFDAVRLGSGWAWDDLADDYSAPLGALCLDRNVVAVSLRGGIPELTPDLGLLQVDSQVEVGPDNTVDVQRDLITHRVHLIGTLPEQGVASVDVAVEDPGLYAAAVLRHELQQAGRTVLGTVRRGPTPPTALLLWRHHSMPLHDLEAHMLKESDNLYAEQFLKTVGRGRTETGLAAEAEDLQLAGPRRVVDGSGLSRYNLVTPRILAGVLLRSYWQRALVDALPVAGLDGTLKKRFLGTCLQDHLSAKTGTMSGVSTLAGVLTLSSGRPIVAVWMSNNFVVPASRIKAFEDKLFVGIAQQLDPTLR